MKLTLANYIISCFQEMQPEGSFSLSKKTKVKGKQTHQCFNPALVKMVTCGGKKATFSERENDLKKKNLKGLAGQRSLSPPPQQVKTVGRDTVDFAPHFEIWQFCCVTCLTKNCLQKLNTFRMHSQAAAGTEGQEL